MTYLDNSGIYKITCVPTGKFYIGSAINIRKRWETHKSKLRKNYHDNQYLQNTWNKYGEDHFIFEVLEFHEVYGLVDRESELIKSLNATDPKIGFNLRLDAGTNIGFKHSDQSRKNMSNARKGVRLSVEHRLELSKSRIGMKLSEEHKAAIGNGVKKRNIEHPEIAEKSRNAASKKFLVISPSGDRFEIINLDKFCRENNLTSPNMTLVAQGKTKHHKGWKCEYL